MPLTPVEFAPRFLDRVQDFDCGDTFWAELAADWIKQAPPFLGALHSIRSRGTIVWLYFLREGNEEHLVGFASLGKTVWSIPPPDGPKRDVGLIPMIAVARAFQVHPPGEKRYSDQIMDHVLDQARQRGYREVCLKVNVANAPALRLYERWGFRAIGAKDDKGNIGMVKLFE